MTTPSVSRIIPRNSFARFWGKSGRGDGARAERLLLRARPADEKADVGGDEART